jgi:hypothetical protein
MQHQSLFDLSDSSDTSKPIMKVEELTASFTDSTNESKENLRGNINRFRKKVLFISIGILLLLGIVILILVLTFKIKPVSPAPCPTGPQASENNPYIVYAENSTGMNYRLTIDSKLSDFKYPYNSTPTN